MGRIASTGTNCLDARAVSTVSKWLNEAKGSKASRRPLTKLKRMASLTALPATCAANALSKSWATRDQKFGQRACSLNLPMYLRMRTCIFKATFLLMIGLSREETSMNWSSVRLQSEVYSKNEKN